MKRILLTLLLIPTIFISSMTAGDILPGEDQNVVNEKQNDTFSREKFFEMGAQAGREYIDAINRKDYWSAFNRYGLSMKNIRYLIMENNNSTLHYSDSLENAQYRLRIEEYACMYCSGWASVVGAEKKLLKPKWEKQKDGWWKIVYEKNK